jgi:hypothetical protein
MRALANQARRLTRAIERLRNTALVGHLAECGRIPKGDLLHPWTDLKCVASLCRLDELAQEVGVGPLKRPDFRQEIEHLLALVKKGCGQYHYAKLEQILAALGHPLRLKQFRSDERRRRTAGKKQRP